MVDAVVGRQAASQLCLSLAKLMQQFHKYSHQKESALCSLAFFGCVQNRVYLHASLLKVKEMWHVTQQQHVSCPAISPSLDKMTAWKIATMLPIFGFSFSDLLFHQCILISADLNLVSVDSWNNSPHKPFFRFSLRYTCIVCVFLLFLLLYFTLIYAFSFFYLHAGFWANMCKKLTKPESASWNSRFPNFFEQYKKSEMCLRCVFTCIVSGKQNYS